MRDRDLIIAGWHKNSFIDYPGKIASVLFLRGCNLRCPYCQNPDIVLGSVDRIIPFETVLEHLSKRKGFIEGVVFSGGEPTLHAGLPDAAQRVRSLGMSIKLDTNGLLPEAIDRVNPDYLALDFKTTPQRYPAVLHSECSEIEERLAASVERVRRMGDSAEVRITLASGCLLPEDAEAIGRIISGVKRVYLQPARMTNPTLDPLFSLQPAFSEIAVEHFRAALSNWVEKCLVRGS